jgi:GAF domain-containing protein
VDEVERLWELFRDLGNSLDLEANLSLLDRGLRRLVEYHAIAVHVLEEGRLRCAYAAPVAFQELSAVPATVAETRRPAINRESGEPGVPLALAVPLEWNRRLAGVLTLYRAQPPRFAEEDVAVLLALAPKLAACVENAIGFGRAQATGTRALFERLDAEVARIRRSHGRLAVIECVLGPDAGGPAAERIAAELRRVCREYDFVARSGDSVVVVLADFAPDAVEETKARVERVVREACLRPRIGVALFPADGCDAEDLLAAAHGAAHA